MRSPLKDAIRALALARKAKACFDADIRAIEDETRAKWPELYDDAKIAGQRVEVLTEAVKKLTLEAYELNPDCKKPAEGVGIRVMTKWIISYDVKKAFDWALKLKTHLQLNVKAFEEMCRQPETRPSFVKVEQVSQPTATIDTVLPC